MFDNVWSQSLESIFNGLFLIIREEYKILAILDTPLSGLHCLEASIGNHISLGNIFIKLGPARG